jgi:DNA-binding GntR family transcriptional regulator
VAFEALAATAAGGSRSLAEIAYERIRDSLLTLEIRPGDPLFDEGIAKELGVGRTPVREALKRLGGGPARGDLSAAGHFRNAR